MKILQQRNYSRYFYLNNKINRLKKFSYENNTQIINVYIIYNVINQEYFLKIERDFRRIKA